MNSSRSFGLFEMTGRHVVLPASCAWIFLCGLSGCDRPDTRIPVSRSEKDTALVAVSEPETSSVTGQIPVTIPESSFQLVELAHDETGIDFVHVSGNTTEKPFPAANGSGVGVVDIDLDGLADLYFPTGAKFPLVFDQNAPTNRIYRNRSEWKFQDVTRITGLEVRGYSSGVAIGDQNSDGFPDIYVTCFGENQLFVNAGDGTFEVAGICDGGQFSTSAAFLDFDGDGLLDIYICNYGHWSWEVNPFCGDKARNVRIFCSPKSLEPEQDHLLRNNGDGSFADHSVTSGIAAGVGRAQGVLATDVDFDGKTDLYIGNDIHPNYFFMNTGNGQFEDNTEMSGTAYDVQGKMQASMGVAGADVNRDGKWDLFTTNFEGEFNTLYLQSDSLNFLDASVTSGLAATSKPWVGWGAAFVDFDLDGWKDLIVTNGHVDDNLKEMGRESPYEEPGLVWKNEAGHFRFLGGIAGDYFQTSHPGRGLAIADLDNDGDNDVVISHQDLRPALLRNDNAGDSITVRLIGRFANRDAVGSRILLSSDKSDKEVQVEQIQGGGSYLSAQDLRVIFSGNGNSSVDLEISWSSGVTTIAHALHAGQSFDIVEPRESTSAQLFYYRPN